MCRAYGSLIAYFLKPNGLKSVVTNQKRAYGSTVDFKCSCTSKIIVNYRAATNSG